MPELQLLSNGSYHLLVTTAGYATSFCDGLAVIRWSADASLDPGGARCYIRGDAKLGHGRTGTHGHDFRAGRASVWAHDKALETRSEFAVALEQPLELRRMIFTNRSTQRLTLSATSYAEIVLSPPATDSAHPAFSKLFIETEFDPVLQTIFATRRPSTSSDPTPWFFHTLLVAGAAAETLSFETDRMRFIGRGRNTDDPQALDDGASLSGSVGPVLDAVAAIQVPFVLEAGASLNIDWFSGVASSREACVALAQQVRKPSTATQILEQSDTYRRALLRTLKINNSDALLYQRMAAALVYVIADLRADAAVLEQNQHGQSDLWKFGISGDVPVVLLQLSTAQPSLITQQMLQAHAYWAAFGLSSELVVLCEPPPAGQPSCFTQTQQTIAAGSSAASIGKANGIFVLDGSALAEGERILLQSVARMVLTDADELSAQLSQQHSQTTPPIDFQRVQTSASAVNCHTRPDDLFACNGYGGFTADGREYVINTSTAHMTPAPWVNVIANPDFGTLVSESGSASTWSENAHEFRLTPWSNDPVSDPNSEAFYIRDEASGHFWSPTLLPTRGAGRYTTRHGFGYSIFEHSKNEIESKLCIYVAIDSPIKFSVLTLHNRSEQPRQLSVTGYIDWVLGDQRTKTQMHVITEIDAPTGALFARNAYNTDFAGRSAFFDVYSDGVDGPIQVCGERADFFGQSGSLAAPAALSQAQLSGRVGAALDPCAVLRVGINLAPGQTQTVIFRLGAGKTADQARDLLQRWRQPSAAEQALDAVHAFWQRTLGAVQVQTPDPTLNVLANGWLLYQVIASRLWGRTAFYQASGAFGFRDQLQDVMALVHAAPDLVREHLLRAASRQFIEGDVQHWWHPPSGKGVRTRCADDFLWLPLVICRYVETTGDTGILDEICPFLQSRALKDGEASNYELPQQSDERASLYQHGVRAIRRGLSQGVHGLPLMGSCDWNDGMNLVGAEGRGESVWMGFFLFEVLTRFAPLADAHGDADFAQFCEQQAQELRTRIETSAWDGAWYRRAWFDDGTLLGSASNSECQIDSIAQSWSVLSGAALTERAQRAMNSLDERLVQRDAQLVQLLDPPFDTSTPSPGYIQGYVPGVRENGGQYTHAAVWAAMAYAKLGDAQRAWELYALLNPLHHTADAAAVTTYKVEPYVLAGDVYSNPVHIGRGGWTWYTGSAGWMLQLLLESLLGLQRSGNQLRLRPLLPAHWSSFDLHYYFGSTRYDISCRRVAAATAPNLVLDGVELDGDSFTLVDNAQLHTVTLNFPNSS